MKNTFYLLLLCLIPFATFAAVHQDIVIKSRFDQASTISLLNQLRTNLKAKNLGDPYSQEWKNSLVIDLSNAPSHLPEGTKMWIRDLQALFQVNALESSYQLVIEKLGYSIQDFGAQLIPGSFTSTRVEYVTIGEVRGIQLKAEKIVFEVTLNRTRSGDPIRFEVELLGPEFKVAPDFLAEIPIEWSATVLDENLRFELSSINLKQLFERVATEPHLINLDVQDIKIPNVSIKVGHKEVKLHREKVKAFFFERKDDLKRSLLTILSSKLGKNLANILGKERKEFLVPKKLTFGASLNGVLDIQKFDVVRSEILQIEVDGYFCESEALLSEAYCANNKMTSKLRRSHHDESYQRSLGLMDNELIEENKTVSISVSEAYLNQMIESSISNGLWDNVFAGKDFHLGPEKSFLLADEAGDFFSLYLDIIYKLTSNERLLVGKSEIRFPVKLQITLRIEEIDGIPHFIVRVENVATDEKLLLEGLPQYDLVSTVQSVKRFRGKVLKGILEKISSFKGRAFVDYKLRVLEGTSLRSLLIKSDGLGRGVGTVGFE